MFIIHEEEFNTKTSMDQSISGISCCCCFRMLIVDDIKQFPNNYATILTIWIQNMTNI